MCVCVYVFLSSQSRNKILCQNDGRQNETSVFSNILQVWEPSNIDFVQKSSCFESEPESLEKVTMTVCLEEVSCHHNSRSPCSLLH